MFWSKCSKILLIFSLILALIGLLTYNVVDYTQYLQGVARAANHPKGRDDNSTIANGIPLRIMFIGASITRGEASTGDRGYRKHIRDTIMSYGNAVNAVGFNRLGDWDDNDVEGWGAFRIRTITKHANQSVPAVQPNLILVQVGTSDCFQDDDIENIGARMRTFVNLMLEAEPRATIIMSTLTTTPRPEREPCILSANVQIRQVAEDLKNEKKPVTLAEMHFDQGLPDRPTLDDIGPDGIHPTDEGYIMMGNIFLESIREVEWRGFLQAPANNGIPDNGDDGREVEDEIKEKAEKEHPIEPKLRRGADVEHMI
ncbi:putative GDSL-like lipase acylhydrolase [Rosellinia necatrix]|uniref:Putative GDSL-like lipase acylhydrolase n=1 Tax=Rosellinia necatrix TaxID=77044 RepID=A0A1S7UL92_ROSNE|nr:putative GDSL-like lipase acylhydrolase [Rosellinia necatrix]